MQQAVQRTTVRLDAAAEREPINIANEMMRLTLDIVTEALFSFDISDRAAEVGEAMDTMTAIGKPRHRKVRAAIELPIKSFMPSLTSAANTRSGSDDLLNMLLDARYDDGSAMPVKQVRDEVMSLLVAGRETTANTLSWTWYLLDQYPDVVAHLEAEIDEASTVACREWPISRAWSTRTKSFRRLCASILRPGLSAGAHWVTTDRRLLYSAHSIVAMSPYTMHRHPDFWDDPERFDPERFTAEKTRRGRDMPTSLSVAARASVSVTTSL